MLDARKELTRIEGDLKALVDKALAKGDEYSTAYAEGLNVARTEIRTVLEIAKTEEQMEKLQQQLAALRERRPVVVADTNGDELPTVKIERRGRKPKVQEPTLAEV